MSNTPPRPPPRPVKVKAIHAFTPQLSTELRLSPGDEIEVRETSDNGWLWGKRVGSDDHGWFPINYTEDVVEHEESNEH